MIEVFYSTAATEGRRKEVAQQTFAWWHEWCRDNRADLLMLTPAIVGCDLVDFNRERRRVAEKESSGNYILTDDDCMPLDGEQMRRGLPCLERQDKFAILSAYPANCTINRWTTEPAEGWGIYEDLEVMEHVSVGGIRFCRKGAMDFWPPRDTACAGYDMIQADYLRSQGWRVGYFQFIRMQHLGEGHSDLQEQWRRYKEELSHDLAR